MISQVILMDKEEKDEKRQTKHDMREETHMMFHRRNWLRHNAMVPKGFLRYHVLEALNEKAMSGSELMEEIQKRTGGTWKPSPGSIYPLLAWLQDNSYVKELPTENGFKRYELTQTGKTCLKNRQKSGKNSLKTRFSCKPIFRQVLRKCAGGKIKPNPRFNEAAICVVD